MQAPTSGSEDSLKLNRSCHISLSSLSLPVPLLGSPLLLSSPSSLLSADESSE